MGHGETLQKHNNRTMFQGLDKGKTLINSQK